MRVLIAATVMLVDAMTTQGTATLRWQYHRIALSLSIPMPTTRRLNTLMEHHVFPSVIELGAC